MPKVQQKRARVHASAAHLSKRAFAVDRAVEKVLPDTTLPTEDATATVLTASGAVPLDTEHDHDHDHDNNTTTQLTKRDKREMRRKRLLERLETTQEALRAEKRKRNKKTVNKSQKTQEATVQVLADWSELSRTISGIDMQSSTADKASRQPNKQPGARKRGKVAQKEMARFQAILGHPAFQANPLAAIRQHVENTFGRPADRMQQDD